MIKKILLGVLAVLLLAATGAGAFAYSKISAFDDSVSKKYEIPLVPVTLSTDPAALERGKHLAEAIGGCTGCHSANLGGGRVEKFGPLATIKMPNITSGKNGRIAAYSDAELARLLIHGVKRDGTTALFMPSADFTWWPDEDVAALISYLRTVPAVDGEEGSAEVGAIGKVLDRQDVLPLDIARRIDHVTRVTAPPPSESAEYGAYVGKLCTGCHGASLSGGPIPGAPPELAVPLNLTPHESGLKEWSYVDFEKLMRQGLRKNGKPVDPFMPMETMKNFNDTELKAVWAYLQKTPAKPLGGR